MQDSRFYSLTLHRLPAVGAVTYQRLVDLFGSPETALFQPTSQLSTLLQPEALSLIETFQQNPEASSIGQQSLRDLDWLDWQPEVRLISATDEVYPPLLRQISKLPPLLFIRGNVHCLSLPQIAIVGSRNPSSGGLENARRFAEFLASNGFAITSGLALGVDAAAHQGAILAKAKTIAVMGTGIDQVYPARHRGLAQHILANDGALVTELPIASGAKAANFPQRNRIISGLSCGVLVVEAAIQSGSLVTAKSALMQNREVFAIPGSIHNPLARGCHQLIRQGATLVETGQDIVDQLDGMLGFQRESLSNLQQRASTKRALDERSLAELSAAEQKIILAMGYDPVNMDELVERTGLGVGSVAGQLVGLELKGFVQAAGVGYQRI